MTVNMAIYAYVWLYVGIFSPSIVVAFESTFL